MKNKVQLITYVDRLGGGGIEALNELLNGPMAGLFGGVHLLPFYFPIDGADAGFDPIDHLQVDPKLGGWGDIQALTSTVDVMADVIVNHMSTDSPQFKHFSAHGKQSPFHSLFLTLDRVFPTGANEADLMAVYRPRPGLPLTYAALDNGDKRVLWTTFTPKQVDIDVTTEAGKAYLSSILATLANNGINMIRLDAVGYAIKKPGSSCFMMPETFAFIDQFAAEAKALGIEVLVEIHSHYRKQVEIAHRVDWVYDFALPPLVLHAFMTGESSALKNWIDIRPQNALTVLDTHDGIGIIDIGADATDRKANPGLVPPEELDRLVNWIHANSRGESKQATGSAASNLDLYQVNCTFYDALGRDDQAYLAARALQFFLPGVPQVYYVGLLAGHNDMELLAKTGVGRDINRHYYDQTEILQQLETSVVKKLCELIRLRNTHSAFNGQFSCSQSDQNRIELLWLNNQSAAELQIDFKQKTFTIKATPQVSGDADVETKSIINV